MEQIINARDRSGAKKNGSGDKKSFIKNPRGASVASAIVLCFLAFLLGASISAALFNVPDMHIGFGDFFADSYGILAFMIPVYLVFAAYLLLDPAYRPNRIFILNSAIFPFLTLAIGFSFLRDFDHYKQTLPLLVITGKNGFSFAVIFLTVMEGFIIAALQAFFFPHTEPRRAIAPAPPRRSEEAITLFRVPSSSKNTGLPETLEELPPESLEPDGEPDLSGIDENLETLNAKLENLDRDTAGLDSRLDSFGDDLESLGTDIAALQAIDAASPRFRETPIDDADEIDSPRFAPNFEELPEVELEDELAEEVTQDAAFEIEPLSAADDLEDIIGEAEAEAARKTEEVLLRERKKKTELITADTAPKKRFVYNVPIDGLLKEYPDGKYWIIDEATRKSAVILKETLNEFNIQAEVTGIRKGPVITMFEILPAPGVKLSKIVNLQDNIALRLAASSVRIVAPIPGKHAVGIEIPNARRNIVSFREIMEGELQREGKQGEIPVVLGKDITGEAVTVDLAAMPHLLIAGSTGSGKSVCVNTMILSILYQCPPRNCRLILIDPKIVELKLYNDIPHLLTPVITEPKRAFQSLQYCIYEMERRYACLDSMGVRDIKTYNKRIKERNIATEHMPYIVVVIDEFADLMATTGKELESTVARLAAMSRAVGIHLVLATQRPSIDVITGLIKSNIPSRIAFMVASMTDSRIIIDSVGAEKLLGKGDMLYAGIVDPFPIRMQGAFVSEEEVERVVAHVKTLGEPDYIDDEIFYEDEEEDPQSVLFEDGEDPLYDKAREIVVQQGKASASYLQRRLKIGYNRAARLVEEMENRGVVGPAQGSRPRELLRAL